MNKDDEIKYINIDTPFGIVSREVHSEEHQDERKTIEKDIETEKQDDNNEKTKDN